MNIHNLLILLLLPFIFTIKPQDAPIIATHEGHAFTALELSAIITLMQLSAQHHRPIVSMEQAIKSLAGKTTCKICGHTVKKPSRLKIHMFNCHATGKLQH